MHFYNIYQTNKLSYIYIIYVFIQILNVNVPGVHKKELLLIYI